MVSAPGSLSFQRTHDGIMAHLGVDEWPADVPLPAEAAVVETGDGPFWPYWRLVLEPNRTVEVVVGWFKTSLPVEEAAEWFVNEMAKLGWQSDLTGYQQTAGWHELSFGHPVSGVRVEISLHDWPYKQETTALIRRVVEHPWAPVAEQPLELTAEIA